jgi:hypothetical protein
VFVGRGNTLPARLATKEVGVPPVIDFGKGSRKRVEGVRWKPSEIANAILLAAVMVILCLAVAFWLESHPF